MRKPHVLMILDGFGHRTDPKDNAILAANTPNLDRLKQIYPHGLISGSGEDVGLPDGQMGNSEVGHMNLGAGRILYQDLTRIEKSIRDGEFNQNSVLNEAIQKAQDANGAVHIFGLLSAGGVHAHEDHIIAMAQLAMSKGVPTYVHAFLDGRDTPPISALSSIQKLEQALAQANLAQAQGNSEAQGNGEGIGKIATLVGRYFAMDRDNRWDRVQKAYDMLTLGQATRVAPTAEEGLAQAYASDETDEFVLPTIIGEPALIKDGDSIVFMNFRADRAREITRAFVEDGFDGFERAARPKLSDYVMLTQYSSKIPANIAFKPDVLKQSIGEYLSSINKTQLRIAETEKYAHVTFFFSGGREDPYTGEDRILIPSPDVATYDLKPEMSAFEVTDALEKAIASQQYDLLVVNYANGDMVGHTGNFNAAVKAVETLDTCVGRIEKAIIAAGGEMLITADHGNVEQMMDYDSGQVHTQHTTDPVPLIYIGSNQSQLRNDGILADIAPTLLQLMGLEKPVEMTGKSLFIN